MRLSQLIKVSLIHPSSSAEEVWRWACSYVQEIEESKGPWWRYLQVSHLKQRKGWPGLYLLHIDLKMQSNGQCIQSSKLSKFKKSSKNCWKNVVNDHIVLLY